MGVTVFLQRIVLATATLAATACTGPSDAEIAHAKSATYAQPTDAVFRAALDVASEDYKIGYIEDAAHRFSTAVQWYGVEGDRISPGAGDRVSANGGSVNLQLLVEILAVDGDRRVIRITPKTFQLISWSPKPRELAPDDPNLPPWIHGRVDALAYKINQRLAKP